MIQLRELEHSNNTQRYIDINIVVLVVAVMIDTLQGFGGNVMKQSGWTKGRGIGRDMAGVSEPIEIEGQSPYCKKGLGLE